MPRATNPGSISSEENVFTVNLNPSEYVTRVSRQGDRGGAQRTRFLRQLSTSTRWALRVRPGGDCFYPLGHLAGHYFFGEWDIVSVLQWRAELWLMGFILKWDDSRLK